MIDPRIYRAALVPILFALIVAAGLGTVIAMCRAGIQIFWEGEWVFPPIRTGAMTSVAILQLRMKLNRVADSELRALCDAMTPDPRLMEASPPSSQGRARRSQTVLKLVE